MLNLSCNKDDEYALLDVVLNKEVSPEKEGNVAIEPNQTKEGEDGALAVKQEIEGIDVREDL